MNTIGFLISTKENEKRRALLPEDIHKIKNKSKLFFEEGYGEEAGILDEEYIEKGANVVTRDEVFRQDIICDPKIGDANYISKLSEKQTIFGWIHAVQNKKITDTIIEKKLTAIAWEDMYYHNRHVFWRNNELAGEIAVLHAFSLYGKLPYECSVAVIGRGNTATGAMKMLTSLGASVTVYDRKTEKLLQKEIDKYDVIVNGVLWDTSRKDHIIYKEDLKKIKKPAMIIDISCDLAGAVETCIPTTIDNPVYFTEGVLHYVVDHTPSLISYSVNKVLSKEVSYYLDDLIEGKIIENTTLNNATIIKDGKILDQRIIQYQNR